MEIQRTSVQDVRQKISNNGALLICAYDDDQKFNDYNLEGAISLSDFKSKSETLAKDSELYFYCA